MVTTLERCFPAMGTYVELSLSSESHSYDDLLNLSILAQEEMRGIENRMSFHDPKSELSALNQLPLGQWHKLSPEMEEVLQFSLTLYHETDGLFDVCIAPTLCQLGMLPELKKGEIEWGSSGHCSIENGYLLMEKRCLLDLGGVAKGYAVDRGLQVLPPEVGALINAGGDLKMQNWPDQALWIKLPSSEQVKTSMQRDAVASSSPLYPETYSIVHPARQEISKQGPSVSVFSPKCMWADALTKYYSLKPFSKDLLEKYDAEVYVL